MPLSPQQYVSASRKRLLLSSSTPYDHRGGGRRFTIGRVLGGEKRPNNSVVTLNGVL